jgi:hypothetical protein
MEESVELVRLIIDKNTCEDNIDEQNNGNTKGFYSKHARRGCGIAAYHKL